MRHANISIALVAAMALALMGCETDRAETTATRADTGAAHEDVCRDLDIKGDYARALAICRKAADTGAAHDDECRDLAIKGDYTRALAICRKVAEQGYAEAQYHIGVMYEEGLGVMMDQFKAVRWYRKAAEQGHVAAQNKLGWIYHYRLHNDVIAAMLFYLAAGQDFYLSSTEHYYFAAKMTPADISKAERLARECTEKNYKGCGF